MSTLSNGLPKFGLNQAGSKAAVREQINKDTNAYLAKGGEITTEPEGKTAMPIKPLQLKIGVLAINSKHQKTVNKFLSWNAKYDAIVDATEDNGGRKQENAYNKASEFFSELPKREQKNLARFVDTVGY